MLSDYQQGQTLVEFLAVRKASIADAKNGKKYLSCTLSDGVTEIQGKQWEFSGEPPKENTIIKLQATMDQYNGVNQLVIQRWRLAEVGECDPSSFIGKCPIPIEEMEAELKNHISSICNQGLADFVHKIITANYDKFITCPGAKGHHHNYIG